MTKNDHYQPEGFAFHHAGRELFFVTGGEWIGWICYRHPDGQWVSLRRASEHDLSVIAGWCRSREAWCYENSYFREAAQWYEREQGVQQQMQNHA